ncbi:rRNA adenine N(6)-methyltransferase family protein [Paenibacillus sp. J23TS9]|uniref:23S ribosomal RNA methyltransferase Erm n=1 Tax=Paenibacillus sp. J23TS9 TaxID=2807193 RepID=UPI001FD0CEBA|nr:rRNA adenine dimethyltransferase family protein [Paenibacillus sp. J23TS9]
MSKKKKWSNITGNKSRTHTNGNGRNFSGQHLLHNKRVVHDLITTAKITKNDVVIDIGAGLGAITLPLAEKAKKVIAFENDISFLRKLHDKVEGISNIRTIHRDFLQGYLPREPFCVVANIPFSITTPILRKLLDPAIPLQRAAIIIEKGAANRFTASLMKNPEILKWRMWYDIEMVQVLAPTYFSPPPKVECSILSIQRKANPDIPSRYESVFMGLAEHGLRNPKLSFSDALREVFTSPQLKHLVVSLGIARDTPMCSLNELQWAGIFQTMVKHVAPLHWPKKSRIKKRQRY